MYFVNSLSNSPKRLEESDEAQLRRCKRGVTSEPDRELQNAMDKDRRVEGEPRNLILTLQNRILAPRGGGGLRRQIMSAFIIVGSALRIRA